MSSSQRRKQQSNRRRVERGAKDIIKMAAVVAVVVAAVIVGIRLSNRPPPADTFCQGVYVNGMSMGGLTYEEGVAQLNAQVDKRLNGESFLLRYGDKQWVFTPGQFSARIDLTSQIGLAWNFGHTGTAREMRDQAAYVKQNPVHYDSEIEYDSVLLEDFIAQIKAEIDVEPVSAQVTVLPDETLEISQSQNGVSLSAETLRQTLEKCIREGTAATIDLVPEVAEPEYTTQELEYNTQLIAVYSTSTKASGSVRNKNIRRALVNTFDASAVQPGETVSFNGRVGARTKANGFYPADEYDGTEVISGIGGGTCQASSTLYGAVLMAGLDVDVRQNHSMTVGYCDPSFDAVVSERGKDLVFTNNLAYPVYIYASVDAKRAEVRIYGPPNQHEIRLENKIVSYIDPGKRKLVKDTSGEHVYYKDEEPVLKSEGKQGLKSRGYRVYYDRTTGAEVEREEFSLDTYRASPAQYWMGVHTRG